MTWVCPHKKDDHCEKLHKGCLPCQPGCVLEGKARALPDDDEENSKKNNSKRH